MWWFLALVGALGVVAALRLWFAPRPGPQLTDNFTGRVTIPCGVDDNDAHPFRLITFTADTLLLIRVDHQCNDEHPVTITLDPAEEGGQSRVLVPPELLSGHTGCTFAVSVPANRTLRLTCGSSVTRHGDCVFYLQNATTAERNLMADGSAHPPAIEGQCGAEIPGRLYNVSGRMLKVRVRWQHTCGGGARLRFMSIDPAGSNEPWSADAAGPPLERHDESMDSGYYLLVKCLPASTANDCRFEVFCRRW